MNIYVGASVPHASDIPIPENRCACRKRRAGKCVGRQPERSLCVNSGRCGGGGVCAGASFPKAGASSVGTGQAVAQGSGAALPFGPWRPAGGPSADGSDAPPRRTDRGRGRAALCGAVGGGDRNLGRSASAQLYGHQAADAAGRGFGRILLVDPALWNPGPECGTRPLAGGFAALTARPRRSCGTGRSTMAYGSVPLTRQKTRCLGGNP